MACAHGRPGVPRGSGRPPSPGSRGSGGARIQAVVAADGQLIRTLTPELVDETCTSSARPEITASPNPAGIPPSSAPWTTVTAPEGPTPWPLAEAGPSVLVGAWSLTTTTNRSPWSVISILTGSAGQCRRC